MTDELVERLQWSSHPDCMAAYTELTRLTAALAASEAERERFAAHVTELLERESVWSKVRGASDCCCMFYSRDTEREYETGTCPHQRARAALATPAPAKTSPLMQRAAEAAEKVKDWSPAKQDFARRVTQSAPAHPSRDAVLEAAKAIFWEMNSVMQDHEKEWRNANQSIWIDCAKAAIRALKKSQPGEG
jgi:hypothetical protein